MCLLWHKRSFYHRILVCNHYALRIPNLCSLDMPLLTLCDTAGSVFNPPILSHHEKCIYVNYIGRLRKLYKQFFVFCIKNLNISTDFRPF